MCVGTNRQVLPLFVIVTSHLAYHFPVIDIYPRKDRKSHRRCSVRKSVLRNVAKFAEKYLCQSLFLIKLYPQACNFIKKETLAQVFSYEFYESEHFFYRKTTGRLLLKGKMNTCATHEKKKYRISYRMSYRKDAFES